MNFTELNRITNYCARRIMDTDTFQQVKMRCARKLFLVFFCFFLFFLTKLANLVVAIKYGQHPCLFTAFMTSGLHTEMSKLDIFCSRYANQVAVAI